jgi:hypothetical protein
MCSHREEGGEEEVGELVEPRIVYRYRVDPLEVEGGTGQDVRP